MLGGELGRVGLDGCEWAVVAPVRGAVGLCPELGCVVAALGGGLVAPLAVAGLGVPDVDVDVLVARPVTPGDGRTAASY